MNFWKINGFITGPTSLDESVSSINMLKRIKCHQLYFSQMKERKKVPPSLFFYSLSFSWQSNKSLTISEMYIRANQTTYKLLLLCHMIEIKGSSWKMVITKRWGINSHIYAAKKYALECLYQFEDKDFSLLRMKPSFQNSGIITILTSSLKMIIHMP